MQHCKPKHRFRKRSFHHHRLVSTKNLSAPPKQIHYLSIKILLLLKRMMRYDSVETVNALVNKTGRKGERSLSTTKASLTCRFSSCPPPKPPSFTALLVPARFLRNSLSASSLIDWRTLLKLMSPSVFSRLGRTGGQSPPSPFFWYAKSVNRGSPLPFFLAGTGLLGASFGYSPDTMAEAISEPLRLFPPRSGGLLSRISAEWRFGRDGNKSEFSRRKR